LLAARTGAQVLPMFCVRKNDGTFDVEVMPPLELVDTGDREADVAANTQTIMDAISAAIRRHPEQWLWLHDRWKSKPVEAGNTEAAAEVVQ
jgi:KDO2-lipid IV(A) lauroyltransferase